jgi:putative CocE/NonD family hydrolase
LARAINPAQAGPVKIFGRLFGAMLGLPPVTVKVEVVDGVQVPMRDGVVLTATLYKAIVPEEAAPSPTVTPTILIRTPYNRGHLSFVGARMAERGFHVLIQDTRGRCGSGGDPVAILLGHERADGRDTARWVRAQPWGGGAAAKVGMWGMSFLGLGQFAAISSGPGDEDEDPLARIDAMCPIMASSRLAPVLRPGGGGLALSLFARWHWVTHRITAATTEIQLLRIFHKMDSATEKPMNGALDKLDHALTGDDTAVGKVFREVIGDDPAASRFWRERDFSAALEGPRAPPVLLVAGFHDFFLREMLEDYGRLVRANRVPVRLVLGPWAHFDVGAITTGMKEGLWWFEQHLKDPRRASRPPLDGFDHAPVQVHISGTDEWRGFVSWPPASTPGTLYLREGLALSKTRPTLPEGKGATDSYCYDPRKPTPAVGGPAFHPSDAGPKSQKAREGRDDILCYTSDPLSLPVEVIGTVTVTLHLRSSTPHCDVYVRLCGVSKLLEISENVCEGYARLGGFGFGPAPEHDGEVLRTLTLELGPTAHVFQKGERIRLQVSSGAHPLYMRNTGSPAGPMDIGTMIPSWHEVLRDSLKSSSITLPVVKGILPT